VGPKILKWMIACIRGINSASYFMCYYRFKLSRFIYIIYIVRSQLKRLVEGRGRVKNWKSWFSPHIIKLYLHPNKYIFTVWCSSKHLLYSTCNLPHICTSSLLGPNILISMLFWNTLILCFYHKMRDHTLITSNPKESTFYLIFTTLGSGWDDQTLWTEAQNG
jgi:hypothetical protein